MKIKLLKLGLFVFVLSNLVSCCDDFNDFSIAIDNNSEAKLAHDICSSKKAVIRDYYDTGSGIATMSIPVPKGHSLTLVKKTKNSLAFETNGKDFTNQYDLYQLTIKGLSKKAGNRLKVTLKIKPTGKDRCSESPSTLGEKNKESIVTGVPFDQKK